MYYLDENNEWQEIILEPSGDTLPIGSIAQFGGSTAPTNWLICNGQAVSRTDYAELFSAIGTAYGDGDGSTTFNVPDFSSRSPMGVGTGTDGTNSETTTLGQEKGEYEHQLTVDEMPSHNHSVTNYSIAGRQNRSTSEGGGLSFPNDVGNITIGNKGGNQAHNTIHPVLGVNFIIKAKQSIGIVGTVTEDITDTNTDAVPTCETVKDYVDEKHTYSTTEQVIGTYLNKPLYRKVILVETTTTIHNQGTVINVPLNLLPLEFMTRFDCITMGNNGINLEINKFIVPDRYDKNNDKVTLNVTTNYTTNNIVVILEYTKFTD